jgi:hypothetical protein
MRPSLLAVTLLATGASLACSGSTGRNEQRAGDARGASPSPAAEGTSATSAGAERVAAGDLLQEPSRYVGRLVSVEAPVTNALSEAAIALGEEGRGQGHGVLVVVPHRTGELPTRGRVTVTGEVMLYDEERLQSGHGWMAATPEIEARYKGQPVIVAQSIRTADGREIVGPAGERR